MENVSGPDVTEEDALVLAEQEELVLAVLQFLVEDVARSHVLVGS